MNVQEKFEHFLKSKDSSPTISGWEWLDDNTIKLYTGWYDFNEAVFSETKKVIEGYGCDAELLSVRKPQQNFQGAAFIKVQEIKYNIWFHFTDFTGNHEDYSVRDWGAAEQEAISIVRGGYKFCSQDVIDKINLLITENKWEEAVKTYNDFNYLKEEILMRESVSGCYS